MDQYTSAEVAQKANKWRAFATSAATSTRSTTRSSSRGESELDPVKRAAIYIKCNDMVVNDFVVIPLISRPRVRGGNLKLVTTLSGWDLDFSALQNWYRESSPAEPRRDRRCASSPTRSGPSADRSIMQRTRLRAMLEDVRAAAWRGAASSPGWRRSGIARAVGVGCCSLPPASRRRKPLRPTSRPSAAAAAPLRLLFWQGPTLLNPHFATGTKDQRGARLFYESLARYDADGNLGAGARRRDPEPRQRRHRRRRPVDHLEAEEGRAVARRPAVHRRRRRLQLAATRPTRRRRPSPSAATRTSRRSSKIDADTVRFDLRQADADLGRAAATVAADPEAPVRGLTSARSRARRRPT